MFVCFFLCATRFGEIKIYILEINIHIYAVTVPGLVCKKLRVNLKVSCKGARERCFQLGGNEIFTVHVRVFLFALQLPCIRVYLSRTHNYVSLCTFFLLLYAYGYVFIPRTSHLS